MAGFFSFFQRRKRGASRNGVFRVLPGCSGFIPGISGLIPGFSGTIPGNSGFVPGSFRVRFVGVAVVCDFFPGSTVLFLFEPVSPIRGPHFFGLSRTVFAPVHTVFGLFAPVSHLFTPFLDFSHRFRTILTPFRTIFTLS
jgi:hypothetical protein